jgi:methionyl aminopeptidase
MSCLTAITKNGITRLAGPPPPDLARFKTDKKVEDEEILKILERPLALARSTGSKGKNKKKAAKKAVQEEEEACSC